MKITLGTGVHSGRKYAYHQTAIHNVKQLYKQCTHNGVEISWSFLAFIAFQSFPMGIKGGFFEMLPALGDTFLGQIHMGDWCINYLSGPV